MQTTGKPREGLMTFVPLAVFVIFVIFALGGPTSFLMFVNNWFSDLLRVFLQWLRNLLKPPFREPWFERPTNPRPSRRRERRRRVVRGGGPRQGSGCEGGRSSRAVRSDT